MKKIKVYLQYPWKISDSQYYKNMVEFPPKEVDFLNSRKNEGMILSKRKISLFNFLKRQIRKWTEKMNLVILNMPSLKTSENFDLIHCAHCLIKSKNKPWVADFESWWQMWISGREKKSGMEKVRNVLESKNCKKIIAWTPWAKNEIAKRFPSIREKIEVVTFAMPANAKKIKNGKKKKTILFMARYFFEKGGLHALEAFDRITRSENNVEAIVISNVPKEIKHRYSQNQRIAIYNLMPHSKIVNEILPKADIFVYPGYSDTFGFAFVEAMSFGIPIVTVDGFSRKYLVENNKTGFVIDRPPEIDVESIGKNEDKLIEDIVHKTLLLINDDKLRNKIGKKSIEEVKNGKFSIGERNRKLTSIYKEAIK